MSKRLYTVLYLIFLFAVQPVSATVEEYRKIDLESNKVFKKNLSEAIKPLLKKASPEVRETYAAIDYQPVWVKRDFISDFAATLLGEIKDDLANGAIPQMQAPFDAMLKQEAKIKEEAPLSQKAEVEVGMMQLYVDYIHTILGKDATLLTPQQLLVKAYKEGSLTELFNMIAKGRIARRTPVLNGSETMLKSDIILDENLTKTLTKGSKVERHKALYAALGYHPVWITEKGLTPFAKKLFDVIESDPVFDHSGPTYKRYSELKGASVPTDKKEIVKREFEIADLYHHYMNYLLYGAIDWKRFKKELKRKYKHGVWDVHEVLLSPELLLIESIQQDDLSHAFEKAKPEFPVFDRLVKGLQRYRTIAQTGGWQTLPDFKDLKPGMEHEVVPLLRRRLQIEGDYRPCEGVDANSTTKYDGCLLNAVKRFQARHGLEAEGYIGKKTRKALSETAQHKYIRLRLTIARLKWLKRDSERYHIVVNIPDFHVTVYDGWNVMEKMRVVTGRKGHETPIFYNRVKRIVLNPYWRIPASIVRHETLPKLKRDPGYTKKKKIEIHTGYSEHSPEINPYKVNWHKYGKRLPPYKFMQSPGKHNALGKIKFLFPNQYSVYMHDTPEKALFAKDIRAFSHGCIRLHRPVDMLEAFSRMDPVIDYVKSKKILEGNKKTPMRLSRDIPIDVIYISAWVNEKGEVQFREDIYGYDDLHIQTAKWLPEDKTPTES
jgi:murein L,D-transpeptidase YcbB/YkuD